MTFHPKHPSTPIVDWAVTALRMRSEVANAIHRRKAPELSFRVVGAT